MLICCCNRRNTEGINECPGDCDPAIWQKSMCELRGYHMTSNNMGGEGHRPIPGGDTCLVCGEEAA